MDEQFRSTHRPDRRGTPTCEQATAPDLDTQQRDGDHAAPVGATLAIARPLDHEPPGEPILHVAGAYRMNLR